ncbi:hypothetical protein [Azonexus sp. R2A61]|uniref:hypothetical protein n=1 Tax=Azonexus sp. R2A61 TaxID=2744443 RepID=UPI001F34A0E2|nr:hypothetical protein [Azonexus sp. R2A61]
MKLSTAFAVSLASAYGLYALGSFALSMSFTNNLEQCQADVVQAVKTKAQIGGLGTVSNACASAESTAGVLRAILR